MSFWKATSWLILVMMVIVCMPACIDDKRVTPVAEHSAATATLIPLFPTSQYTPLPTVVEPGLAAGVPCKPPCWQGVTPGDSASAAEVAMQQLRASGWAHAVKGGGDAGGYSIYPLPTISGSIHVLIEDEIVTTIMGNLLFDYDIGSLVKLLEDDPEWLYLVTKGGGCTSCEEWSPVLAEGEGFDTPAHLLYPNQGLYFMALIPYGANGCICPEMEIVSFCYYLPMSIEEVLHGDRLPNLCHISTKSLTEADLTEWHGFGGGY